MRAGSVLLALAGSVLTAGALSGCGGKRVYGNGINHMYLCAVRVVRVSGYQVREQDFKRRKGTLVAALSAPDPRRTSIKRGFMKRTGEVIWNLWEHGRLETWDSQVAQERIRTEERVVVKFRSGSGPLSWLGLGSGSTTTVKVRADVTEYGREDWVIRRTRKDRPVHDDMYLAMAQCLNNPAAFRPPERRKAEAAPEPPATASADAPAAARDAAGAAAPDEEAPAATAEPVEDPTAVLDQGRGSYEVGDYRKAVGLMLSVVATEPENAEAWGYLGAAHYHLGELDRSVSAYERYVKLVPRDLRTREFLDEIRKERGK